jgi:hypothetical protein
MVGLLMAVLSFAATESDAIFVRNAILRMVLSRAERHLVDPADIEALELPKLLGAISFDLIHHDQRARLVEAVYRGTHDLKHEITVGIPTEEPVRAGIQEKLDEILALISCFRYQDRER